MTDKAWQRDAEIGRLIVQNALLSDELRRLRERAEKAEQALAGATRLLKEALPHIGWVRQGFADEVLSIRRRIEAVPTPPERERTP
jgi:hypothetical protein